MGILNVMFPVGSIYVFACNGERMLNIIPITDLSSKVRLFDNKQKGLDYDNLQINK